MHGRVATLIPDPAYDSDEFYAHFAPDLPGGLGFIKTSSWYAMGPNDETFGDPGMGGAVGWADPKANLSFAFTPNRMVFSPGRTDPRIVALSSALYGCL